MVIGSREAVDVARKVVNALPGQPRMSAVADPGQADRDFRARYGLGPRGAQSEPVVQSPDETQEQFRRRYGLRDNIPANPPPNKK